MENVFEGMINTMELMGADVESVSVTVNVKGNPYWIHIDIHKLEKEEGDVDNGNN